MKHTAVYLLIALLAIFMLTISAFAADAVSFDLDELDMTISLPADYVAFTRDISDSDPNLSAYGLTKDGLYSLMTSNGMYLDAWDVNVDHEITVTMTENTVADLNQYTDESLSDFVSNMKSEYQNSGITFIKSEIYKHNQVKFIKIYFSRPNGDITAYGVQYLTIYASKSISIYMHSYLGKIGESEENIQKSIVDSIKFGTDPQSSAVAASTGDRDQLLDAVMDGNITAIITIIGIDIIATIFLYSLPIIIYRYAVKKSPVENKKAIKITVTYGIAAFIFVSVLKILFNGNGLAGRSILLWTAVNYRVLISGANKSARVPSQKIEPKVYKDKIVKKLKPDKRCPVCGCYITNPTGACNACGYMPTTNVKTAVQNKVNTPLNNSAKTQLENIKKSNTTIINKNSTSYSKNDNVKRKYLFFNIIVGIIFVVLILLLISLIYSIIVPK